jgi:hypothetical protein
VGWIAGGEMVGQSWKTKDEKRVPIRLLSTKKRVAEVMVREQQKVGMVLVGLFSWGVQIQRGFSKRVLKECWVRLRWEKRNVAQKADLKADQAARWDSRFEAHTGI